MKRDTYHHYSEIARAGWRFQSDSSGNYSSSTISAAVALETLDELQRLRMILARFENVLGLERLRLIVQEQGYRSAKMRRNRLRAKRRGRSRK
jgi:hypothetical protein